MNLPLRGSLASVCLLFLVSLIGCSVNPFDPKIPPVAIADLKPVLDADLALALAKGPLAPATHGGVAIGVVQHGVRRIYAYGTAQPDSLFEIGSITKTFTGLMLAQMVEQGQVRLDEPVRELLPPGTVAKPVSGAEITLVDISDQHAALPRLPDNLHPADSSNPYVDYDSKALYAFLAKHGVAHPGDTPYLYSNLAVGLLGQALANRAGVPYAALLHDEITGPLGMTDTTTALTPALRARLIQGYKANGQPAPPWEFDALAGCGAIRSTAADMLTYLEAQLHPEGLPRQHAAYSAGQDAARGDLDVACDPCRCWQRDAHRAQLAAGGRDWQLLAQRRYRRVQLIRHLQPGEGLRRGSPLQRRLRQLVRRRVCAARSAASDRQARISARPAPQLRRVVAQLTEVIVRGLGLQVYSLVVRRMTEC